MSEEFSKTENVAAQGKSSDRVSSIKVEVVPAVVESIAPVSMQLVSSVDESEQLNADAADDKTPKEINGPKGPEPTRYGDWEKNGRCYDF